MRLERSIGYAVIKMELRVEVVLLVFNLVSWQVVAALNCHLARGSRNCNQVSLVCFHVCEVAWLAT